MSNTDSSVILVGVGGRSRAGERTLEIVTDGRVGAQAEAQALADRTLGAPMELSFRKSEHGEIRFYFVEAQR